MFEILKETEATSASGEKVSITVNDLHEIAESYDASNPAPLVKGHPKDDSPAEGWVDSLKVVGNKLFAVPKDIANDFVQELKDKRYAKISASLHKRESTANPNKGKLSLKHVGFLGGMAPAIPMGTIPTSDFSDDGDCLYFDFSLTNEKESEESVTKREDMSDKDKIDLAEFDALKSESERMKTQIDSLTAENEKLSKVVRLSKKAAQEDEVNSFCESLVEGGNILPNQVDGVKSLLSFAHNASDSMDFSEGENPVKSIKEFLGELKQMDFSEKTDEEAKKPISFNAPVGTSVTDADAKNYNRIAQYAKENDMSLVQATIELENKGEL